MTIEARITLIMVGGDSDIDAGTRSLDGALTPLELSTTAAHSCLPHTSIRLATYIARLIRTSRVKGSRDIRKGIS